jgi:Fe-S oxidoreductase
VGVERLILLVLVGLSAVAFWKPAATRYAIVRKGKGSLRVSMPGPRIRRFVSEVLLQTKIIRERPIPGIMHALVFWGFVAFGVETLDHFANGFGGTILGHGALRAAVSRALIPFAVLVLIGIASLAIRRAVLRPKALGKFSAESMVVSGFIMILMITFLLPELGFADEATLAGKANWWIHTIVILVFLPLIVHSKHLHLLLSPVTTFLKGFTIAPLQKLDFEKEEFGAEKLSDLHQHTLLGAFTCVECGRCQDHCPAHNTGKLLNPKALMLDLERGLLADPSAVAVRDDLVKEEVLWQCTTCGACSDQCPVGIDQVVPIIDLRRGLVAAGSFPDTFKTFFKNMETAGNPWAYQAHTAVEFIEEARYPTFDGSQDVLYWMGCMARYDDTARKVSKSFTRILDAANVRWGVLSDETCTGDAARRAGNEFVFVMQAEQNVAAINATSAKKIVATCPHCVRSLEEYRDFGLREDIEIVHHTELIDELQRAEKLPSGAANGATTTYHDPCYLSRYRKPTGVAAPRAVLSHAGQTLSEPERTKTRSFCCGAGGAMLFTEERAGKRINHERTDELLATGAPSIAVACPFCRMMIRDGLSDRGKSELPVRDVAELVAASLPDSPTKREQDTYEGTR